MPLTDYAKNKIGDGLFRGQTIAQPTTLYFSLHTSTTPAAANEFASSNGYARVGLASALTSFKGTGGTTIGASNGSGGQFTNAAQITFGSPSPSAWSDAYGVGVWDAPSGGNLWYIGSLTASKSCPANIPVLFDIGALTFLLT